MDFEAREEEEDDDEEEEEEVCSEMDVLVVAKAGGSCWVSFANTLRHREREEWKE